ncbi:hypothetical protein GLOTRDRAFT_127478 [Gloeophyllum trabeum ATCC 11539]|uniref:Uncharacterized protein n=1 Tax=Gloeophyllum trabeum (strain ATCC 11539 / FP-39264 / Madison 617) TaxID=670483 RepID=S7QAZ9_GLOTA|nr:uncharacterized protein GLOTRDRAFT_127478 [Gloeophyllum trabeum ATCC 11539]EPQ57101.1 hypothetical protein GLOTRDRAFT_127478 [Gloeophyllum trabeum ATCC 11539]
MFLTVFHLFMAFMVSMLVVPVDDISHSLVQRSLAPVDTVKGLLTGFLPGVPSDSVQEEIFPVDFVAVIPAVIQAGDISEDPNNGAECYRWADPFQSLKGLLLDEDDMLPMDGLGLLYVFANESVSWLFVCSWTHVKHVCSSVLPLVMRNLFQRAQVYTTIETLQDILAGCFFTPVIMLVVCISLITWKTVATFRRSQLSQVVRLRSLGYFLPLDSRRTVFQQSSGISRTDLVETEELSAATATDSDVSGELSISEADSVHHEDANTCSEDVAKNDSVPLSFGEALENQNHARTIRGQVMKSVLSGAVQKRIDKAPVSNRKERRSALSNATNSLPIQKTPVAVAEKKPVETVKKPRTRGIRAGRSVAYKKEWCALRRSAASAKFSCSTGDSGHVPGVQESLLT